MGQMSGKYRIQLVKPLVTWLINWRYIAPLLGERFSIRLQPCRRKLLFVTKARLQSAVELLPYPLLERYNFWKYTVESIYIL